MMIDEKMKDRYLMMMMELEFFDKFEIVECHFCFLKRKLTENSHANRVFRLRGG